MGTLVAVHTCIIFLWSGEHTHVRSTTMSRRFENCAIIALLTLIGAKVSESKWKSYPALAKRNPLQFAIVAFAASYILLSDSQLPFRTETGATSGVLANFNAFRSNSSDNPIDAPFMSNEVASAIPSLADAAMDL